MEWPDWKDTGKLIEAKKDNGEIVIGTLFIDDFFFDGENEVPEFTIKTSDHKEYSFVDFDEWRFI
jgi:hypothetical protein